MTMPGRHSILVRLCDVGWSQIEASLLLIDQKLKLIDDFDANLASLFVRPGTNPKLARQVLANSQLQTKLVCHPSYRPKV